MTIKLARNILLKMTRPKSLKNLHYQFFNPETKSVNYRNKKVMAMHKFKDVIEIVSLRFKSYHSSAQSPKSYPFFTTKN